MKSRYRLRAGATTLLLCTPFACAKSDTPPAARADTAPPVAAPVPAPPPARPPLTADQRKSYYDAARLAWKFFEDNDNAATGLIDATPNWKNTTLWDVGTQLVAMHAGKELGFITQAEFDRRMKKTLATLQKLPLYRGLTFNKLYTTAHGTFGSEGRPGWSATDMGRFLAALKVLAVTEPRFAATIDSVVHRNDFSQIVIDGYLHGQEIGSSGKPYTYQEGRIGYEQYVALGFSQWGADVAPALAVQTNAVPDTVLGVPIPRDKRYDDRIVSEPFLLEGLEFGLRPDMRELAENVLKAQIARYDSTGQITIATEDAVDVPPIYFYYFCVMCNGKPFVVDIADPGHERTDPKWISTKGAYAWDALFPSDYTRKAVAAVAPARDPARGWGSGVYEKSGKSTGSYNINTSGVLLEVALYQLRGGVPLIQPATVQK